MSQIGLAVLYQNILNNTFAYRRFYINAAVGERSQTAAQSAAQSAAQGAARSSHIPPSIYSKTYTEPGAVSRLCNYCRVLSGEKEDIIKY